MKIEISQQTLKSNLMHQIGALSGQNLLSCNQCGKCAAGCPSIESMDLLPSKVVRLVQLGQVERALQSKTIWLCAACHICKVRCPQGVDLARIMEALRQTALRKWGNYVRPNAIAQENLDRLPVIALIANFRKLTC